MPHGRMKPAVHMALALIYLLALLELHIDDLVQDYRNSVANALELAQSFT